MRQMKYESPNILIEDLNLGAFEYVEYLCEIVLVSFYFTFNLCMQLADNATNLQSMKLLRDETDKEVTQLKATIESIREKVGSLADQIFLNPTCYTFCSSSINHTKTFLSIYIFRIYLNITNPKLHNNFAPIQSVCD